MTTIGDGVGPSNAEVLVPAFAKLQGENFEYYMRKYSIMLGRNSKKKSVDLDLKNLGGGTDISRHHARIYYDFTFRCFALEVIGRNGCIIRNFLFMPGGPLIKLNSQDLLQIGEVRFYFLLPTRSFVETLEAASQIAPPLPPQLVVVPPASSNDERKGGEREGDMEESLGVGHGEGGVSGLIVQGSNAREAEGSSDILSGGLEAGRQILPPLTPLLVAVPLASSNDERKGEEREGNREESLGVGHGEVDVSGLIVDEFNAREAERPSGVLSGALEAARHIAPPLPPPLVVVVPTSSNDERKGEDREGDREESQGIGHGEGVSGLIVEFNAREAGGSSSELSGALEAARQIVPPPLEPQLMVVPPTASNNERKDEEREGDREGTLGFGHGEGGVSGLIVEKSNAREVEGSSGILSGGLEAGSQIPPPLLPPQVAVPIASSNDERKGEERESNREESLGVGHGEVDVNGLIVDEFNAREAERPSGVLSGALEAARQVAPPLPPPLVVVPPTSSNDERKGEEREGDREESQGIGHGEGVSGLIVKEFNAREAGSLSSELSVALEAARHIVPPPLEPQLMVVPPATSNYERKGEEREGDREESLGFGHDEGGVGGLIVQKSNAIEVEGSSGILSGGLEAGRHIPQPLPPPQVAVPLASSNDERKSEEKECNKEESLGVEHGEGDVCGLIVEEFNAKEAGCSSGMLSGGIEQYSLSNEKLEPRSGSDREANNQEETPDVHVLQANLPGIKKDQIKLEVEDGKIWIQISAEHIVGNEEKTDLWHCVEDSSSKFLRRYFMLPENAKIDQIKATMKKDVLTVTVSKGEIEMPGQPVVKSIEICD